MRTLLALTFSFAALAAPFTDADLRREMRHNRAGLIYVWSPLMPLSVHGLEEARAVARELGLGFTAVVDGQAAELAPGQDTLESQRLLRMGVMNHYPAMVVYRRGKVLPHYVQGYEAPAGLKTYLSDIVTGRIARLPKRNAPQAQLVPGVRAGRTVKTLPVQGVPSYFFKVSAGGEHLSYNLNNTNYLMKTADARTTAIPGPFDPVFNVDGTSMILPIQGGARNIYYGLYSVDDLWRSGISTAPRLTDTEMHGVYQSVGELRRQGDRRWYRVIAETATQHPIREYEWNARTGAFAAAGEIKFACPNYRIKLPMISKDGREIGGIDLATRTSAIFRINDDGGCTKVLDIGLRTGKMNFSHDGTKVLFHVFSDGNDGYVDRPSAGYTADVYLLDRATGRMQKVVANTAANALYPDFTRDGNVVYAHYPHNSEQVEFRIVRF